VSRAQWDRLVQAYRLAVGELDSAVKRASRLVGKEFEDEHKRIEQAQKACEKARRDLNDFLNSGG